MLSLFLQGINWLPVFFYIFISPLSLIISSKTCEYLTGGAPSWFILLTNPFGAELLYLVVSVRVVCVATDVGVVTSQQLFRHRILNICKINPIPVKKIVYFLSRGVLGILPPFYIFHYLNKKNFNDSFGKRLGMVSK